MTEKITIYEDRFIAFIDILGFSSIVGQTVNNPAIAKRIHQALSRIAAIKEDNEMCCL